MDWSSLVQKSEDNFLQVEDGGLPRVQRTFQQIAQRAEQLSNRLRVGVEDTHTATLLLAREGIDPTALMQEVRGLPLAPADEFYAGLGAETSLTDFLRSVHEAQIMSCITDSDADAVDRFDFATDRLRETEWAREKAVLLPQLGRGLLSARVLSESREAAARGTGPDRVRSRLNERAEAYVAAVEAMNSAVASGQGEAFCAVDRFRAVCPEPSPMDTALATAKDIWTLLSTMAQAARGVSAEEEGGAALRSALLRGARRYLESDHANYLQKVISKFPSLAQVGGRLQNTTKVEGFLRVKLQERQGMALDIDGGPLDTFWMRVFYCLRSGFTREAADMASGNDQIIGDLIGNWERNGGTLSPDQTPVVIEEIQRVFSDLQTARGVRPVHKAAVLVVLAGDRIWHDALLRECPTLLSTMEDFLWFKLAVVRERDDGAGLASPSSPGPSASTSRITRYTLADLQAYLNRFPRTHYTKEGREPLLYVSVLAMSLQFHEAVTHLCRDLDDPIMMLDGLHIGLALQHDKLLDIAGNPAAITPSPSTSGARAASTAAASSSTPPLSLPQLLRDYGNNLQKSCDSLERGVVLALQYYSIVRRMVAADQQESVTRELLKELLRDTQAYSLLLGPSSTGDATAPALQQRGLLSKLEPNGDCLRALLLNVANEMETNAEYYKALRIYMNEREEGRALSLVNKELLRLLKDVNTLMRSLPEFQIFVDLGRDCLDKLRGTHDPITQQEARNFSNLQRIRDAFVQERKKQYKQVLQTLEEIRLLIGGVVAYDSQEFSYLVDHLPEVVLVAARCTFNELQDSRRTGDAAAEGKLRAQFSSILGSASRHQLTSEILRELDILRLQAASNV